MFDRVKMERITTLLDRLDRLDTYIHSVPLCDIKLNVLSNLSILSSYA
jgi:hypothetical protein